MCSIKLPSYLYLLTHLSLWCFRFFIISGEEDKGNTGASSLTHTHRSMRRNNISLKGSLSGLGKKQTTLFSDESCHNTNHFLYFKLQTALYSLVIRSWLMAVVCSIWHSGLKGMGAVLVKLLTQYKIHNLDIAR